MLERAWTGRGGAGREKLVSASSVRWGESSSMLLQLTALSLCSSESERGGEVRARGHEEREERQEIEAKLQLHMYPTSTWTGTCITS